MTNWFSRTDSQQEPLKCARCGNSWNVFPPYTNHQSSRCPFCNVACLFCTLPDFHLQIVLEDAPLFLAEIIRFLQRNLNELTFAHLLLCISQIAEPNRKKWGYSSGEFAAYVKYLRGKDQKTRDIYNLGDPDDPELIIPMPRPKDFVWPVTLPKTNSE